MSPYVVVGIFPKFLAVALQAEELHRVASALRVDEIQATEMGPKPIASLLSGATFEIAKERRPGLVVKLV
jgi:hypothetical protein